MDFPNLFQLIIILITAYIGFFFGSIRPFREQKQKMYAEILPSIISMAYNPQKESEKDFSAALMKLWLYSSKKVARKTEHAIMLFHHQDRGDVTRTFQEAIVEMRRDIQIWPWHEVRKMQKIKTFQLYFCLILPVTQEVASSSLVGPACKPVRKYLTGFGLFKKEFCKTRDDRLKN